ncbi:transglycosylase SLT domain-containing protein [Flammeovirga aprica]|uniref:Lytic transglycosylase domain-containing protein n=1 Tax=Flammeovirga aprica JL-4 TaxID=694437 RepID=A0A7X9P334_9BACT|nr:transglycosylase SLT domain-containing protein [Flammeovirga aprica]NME68649.1 lytic transglycosylase domain-containing protein [Flammeovirga aprica JL-4]
MNKLVPLIISFSLLSCGVMATTTIPDSIVVANQVILIDEDGKKRILQKYLSLTKSQKFYHEYLSQVNQSIFNVNGILSKYKLHTDLKYVAALESHMNPKAESRTGAKGIWQFKYDTAMELGLIYDNADKRECVMASTHAVAQYFMHHLDYLEEDYLKVILAHHLGLQGTLMYMKNQRIQKLNQINKNTHIYLIHYLAHYIALNKHFN